MKKEGFDTHDLLNLLTRLSQYGDYDDEANTVLLGLSNTSVLLAFTSVVTSFYVVFEYRPVLLSSPLLRPSGCPIDPGILTGDPLTDFQRSEELRTAATGTWAASGNRTR